MSEHRMDPEHHEQLRRLQKFRRAVAAHNAPRGAIGSTQEDGSTTGCVRYGSKTGEASSQSGVESHHLRDPLIYPGLYASSGFDIMGILIRVRTRPNPVIDVGKVDSAVALVLCDNALPDLPIVYCSEPFEALTGYSSPEVLGKNCRFLQRPPPSAGTSAGREAEQINEQARAKLRHSIASGDEAQVRLVNYNKAGVMFFNLLTTIPISWDEGALVKRYLVGFQAQENALFR